MLYIIPEGSPRAALARGKEFAGKVTLDFQDEPRMQSFPLSAAYYQAIPEPRSLVLGVLHVLETDRGTHTFGDLPIAEVQFELKPAAEAVVTATETGDKHQLSRLLAEKEMAATYDLKGRSLLHIAAGNGDAETARVLLRAGSSPNALNRRGKTELDLALAGVVSIKVQGVYGSPGSSLRCDHWSILGLLP